MTRLPRIALMVMLLALVYLPLPISPAAPSITGGIGDSVYLTDIDTLDVKIIKQDGVPVLTTSIIGYGTLAARNASPFATGNFWWVTDGQPPYFSRYNGASWDILRTDPTWPIAPQTLQATHQILGCGTDRATIRLVSIQGDGGPITLSSNPQIPAGADGQVCVLWGTSATATLTVADGNGIELDGISTYTVSTTQSLTLAYSTFTSRWRQIASSSSAGGGGDGGGTPAGATVSTTLVNLSGPTATATGLIPADSWVFGVTVGVTNEVTGVTSFAVGDGIDPNRWGDNIAITDGTQTNISDFTVTTPAYVSNATNVVLTAQGGNFTGGTVDIIVTYVTLETLIGGGASGGGVPSGGAAHQVLKRSGDNTTLEWASILGTENQIEVALSLGAITLTLPQNIDPGSSPTFAGMTMTRGTKTTSAPVTHTEAWNNSNVTFIGKTNDFTDTASGLGSTLERWRVGGLNKVDIRKDGMLTAQSIRTHLVTVTTNYTLASDVAYVMCDAAAGAVTITLPDATVRTTGAPVWIKKVDSSANYCLVARTGTDTIEGATTLPLQIQYQGRHLVPAGADLWVVFAN